MDCTVKGNLSSEIFEDIKSTVGHSHKNISWS